MKEHEKEAERIWKVFSVFYLCDWTCDYQVCEVETKSNSIKHIEEKYKCLREQLFNLKSCRVIVSEKTYLHRLDELILEEQQVKEAIQNK